jgi:hypothetical protein
MSNSSRRFSKAVLHEKGPGKTGAFEIVARFRAFSSEVDKGSREENASKKIQADQRE